MSESFDRPRDAFESDAAASAAREGGCTVAIHQPNYLPWLGYFEKIRRSDVFVLLDDAEYTSGSWINRNRIKTPHDWTWLTVPVRGTSGAIADVEIVDDGWRETHRKSLQASYGGAAHYEEFAAFFAATYARSWESLCELNVHLVRQLADRLGLDCEFVRASTLEVDAAGSERIVRLCEELGADRYYSGEGARSYNDHARFEDAGIALEYQSFDPPRYEQRFGEFLSNLSIVDPLMNLGAVGTRELLEEASGDA
ncbi:WbqC-like family protein [Natronococcus amylolyticus DSM 10524]|uniref:WbqC-like family protein n=1 Tax=Natronococcus amylolyticus DSM 10524 TaxID=1227497 RepID=L9XD77_9EURY|nr:WbqC family protein [Natronococcus amylolyticus]ELY59669.1 WbqC-like family protein [Natronococcus amylolyticus DSM 10524]